MISPKILTIRASTTRRLLATLTNDAIIARMICRDDDNNDIIVDRRCRCRCPPPAPPPRDHHRRAVRTYFTDADRARRSDPFAMLGLTWGATSTEIKDAYRRLARELHPDVSSLDPAVASGRFRQVREAYDVLMNNNNKNGNGMRMHGSESREGWSFRTWRSGDVIAQERTDVAGVMRKRPVRPAESRRGKWGVASLGHPDGRGAVSGGRGEYLGSRDEGGARQRSSTVGTGNSKWVRRKEFRPWNPEEGSLEGAGKYSINGRLFGRAKEEKPHSD